MEKFSYLNRSNLEYIEELYEKFRSDPESLPPEWRMFFEGVEFSQNWASSKGGHSLKELDVFNLIQAYRDYGHLKADLDPLNIRQPQTSLFDLKQFNLTAKNMDQSFHVGSLVGLGQTKLKDIIAHMEKSYCGTLTAQIAECRPEVRDWFRNEFEGQSSRTSFSNTERTDFYRQLARTESLEKFLHTRFVGAKRFSIEGGDSLIPMLESMVSRGTGMRVEEIVIGMAHRGRINVLANFMDKGIELIFAEFEGAAFKDFGYDGDVKYHLGYSTDKQTPNGPCHISLAFNPSHLEAVDPVVLGMTRAKQRSRQDTKERKKVLPVLIHGDAAFAGQGVVAESLQLSKLPGYTVGGAIHIIINNQIGFTTDPSDARSCTYSSDVAKAIKAPVILVNGDDVEACVRASDMALRFRQFFGEDVVIDLICYRRFGHNEGDEPAFTQPKMYSVIKSHPTTMKIYAQKLESEGLLTTSEADQFFKEKIDNLQKILDETRKSTPQAKPNAYGGAWKGLRRGTLEDFDSVTDTQASSTTVKAVARVLGESPKNFNLHPKIAKLVQSRSEMLASGKIDWALSELLAYGTLCMEGTPVRISGQDCKRGTFSHRQAVYFDTETGKEFIPLATLNPEKGEFCIYNSLLSEMAVVGFEYGNSCSDPTYLTVWEAQFGDFANGAQIIIDQFLSSGEEKWVRVSGLTLLLPHGYEGGGPEHSSARLERFLQLCAQANMQVCNITTPANLFHVLRRQVKRDFRKPLVIMSPKSLLRHPKVISKISELSEGRFLEVIEDPSMRSMKSVETLLLCSGKLYYDLDHARDQHHTGREDLAIVRVEQLYPFPRAQLTPLINGSPKLSRIIWAQEEPKNMGAWTYIQQRLQELLEDLGKSKTKIEYVGRTERASPAVGSHKTHEIEQAALIAECFKG